MLKALLVRFWSTTLLLIRRWNDDECFTRSAAMAFYAAFSLFPLCLILMAVLGFVARFSQTAQTEQERLIQIVEEGTTPWIAAQLGHVLSQVQTKATVGGPLGLAILVVTALGMFAQLDSALDRIWRGPALNSPGFWYSVRTILVDRLVAFLWLLGLGLVLGVFLIANLSMAGIEKYLAGWSTGLVLWRSSQSLFAPLIYMVVFTLLYKFLPKDAIRWRDALRGGLMTAVAWWLGQFVLQWLIVGDHYSAYGVIGSFMGILAWLYYVNAALFLGAELVHVLSRAETPAE